jgi:hypothetical protein
MGMDVWLCGKDRSALALCSRAPAALSASSACARTEWAPLVVLDAFIPHTSKPRWFNAWSTIAPPPRPCPLPCLPASLAEGVSIFPLPLHNHRPQSHSRCSPPHPSSLSLFFSRPLPRRPCPCVFPPARASSSTFRKVSPSRFPSAHRTPPPLPLPFRHLQPPLRHSACPPPHQYPHPFRRLHLHPPLSRPRRAPPPSLHLLPNPRPQHPPHRPRLPRRPPRRPPPPATSSSSRT